VFIPKKINKSQILNEKKKEKKREIRSDQDHDQIRSRSRSDQIRSRSRSDQIRSRFDPEIGARMLGGPLRWLRSDDGFGATVTVASVRAERSVREKARWLRCDGDGGGGFGASREIGERESEVARGWLGMSWAREKARWLGVLGVARGVGGGSGWLGVARDGEKESRE
jgi:hypothetical protein